MTSSVASSKSLGYEVTKRSLGSVGTASCTRKSRSAKRRRLAAVFVQIVIDRLAEQRHFDDAGVDQLADFVDNNLRRTVRLRPAR